MKIFFSPVRVRCQTRDECSIMKEGREKRNDINLSEIIGSC